MAVSPPALKPGDTIGVFAPSSWVEKADIEKSKTLLEERGYNVFIHPQTYERENQSAGNHLQKSLAFQGLWQRKDIKAIWAAGGGNRCMHLLETINFAKLTNAPKILLGFSDVTALLNAVYAHTKITTFHAPVFKNVHKHKELDHLLTLLESGNAQFPLAEDNVIQSGKAQGHLVGGNLSLFQYLPQTLPNDFYKDAIIFLEDCHEELSRVDRMLLHLKRIGAFKDARAVVFGQFTDLQDSSRPFGYTLEDIIREHTNGLDIPILHNMPFGHGDTLYSMPIGAHCEIDTDNKSFTVSGAVS